MSFKDRKGSYRARTIKKVKMFCLICENEHELDFIEKETFK